MTMKLVFKLPEVGQMLGVSFPTLKKVIAAGDIRTIRVGGREMVTREELERYVGLGLSEADGTSEAA